MFILSALLVYVLQNKWKKPNILLVRVETFYKY